MTPATPSCSYWNKYSVDSGQGTQGEGLGALIMLGTLFGLIAAAYGLVLRYDPEARAASSARRIR